MDEYGNIRYGQGSMWEAYFGKLAESDQVLMVERERGRKQ